MADYFGEFGGDGGGGLDLADEFLGTGGGASGESGELDPARPMPQKDAVLFLVDGSESMFENPSSTPSAPAAATATTGGDGGDATATAPKPKAAFESAVRFALGFSQDKVITADKDYVGLVIYNAKQALNVYEFQNLFVFQEMDCPSANRIQELTVLANSGDKQSPSYGMYVQGVGHAPTTPKAPPLSEALWAAQHMMNHLPKSVMTKRIFILTDKQNPPGNDPLERDRCFARMKDLAEAGVTFEVFAHGFNILDAATATHGSSAGGSSDIMSSGGGGPYAGTLLSSAAAGAGAMHLSPSPPRGATTAGEAAGGDLPKKTKRMEAVAPPTASAVKPFDPSVFWERLIQVARNAAGIGASTTAAGGGGVPGVVPAVGGMGGTGGGGATGLFTGGGGGVHLTDSGPFSAAAAGGALLNPFGFLGVGGVMSSSGGSPNYFGGGSSAGGHAYDEDANSGYVGAVAVGNFNEPEVFAKFKNAICDRAYVQRTTGRLEMRIGTSTACPKMQVKVYLPIVQAKKPSFVWVESASNDLVTTESRTILRETGAEVSADEITYNVKVDDSTKVRFAKDEVATMKGQFGLKGLTILGFKDKAAVKHKYSLSKCAFIHCTNDDGENFQTTKLFVQLYRSCITHGRVAIAQMIARPGSAPRLVALVPNVDGLPPDHPLLVTAAGPGAAPGTSTTGAIAGGMYPTAGTSSSSGAAPSGTGSGGTPASTMPTTTKHLMRREAVQGTGFYVVQLPYAEDIRSLRLDNPDKPRKHVGGGDDLVIKAKKIIKELALGEEDFGADDFHKSIENPALRRQYHILQTMALMDHSADASKEPEDQTLPDTEGMVAAAKTTMDSFRNSCFFEGYSAEAFCPAPKPAKPPPTKEEIESIDYDALEKKGTLASLTIPYLKEYLKLNGEDYSTASLKADYINLVGALVRRKRAAGGGDAMAAGGAPGAPAAATTTTTTTSVKTKEEEEDHHGGGGGGFSMIM